MRIWRAILALVILPVAAKSEQISTQALLQYQYDGSNNQCAVTLKNGLRIEFSGVFANEDNNVTFRKLVIVAIPKLTKLRFAEMTWVMLNSDLFRAKVVKIEPERTWLALDASFVAALWGSSSTDDRFEVRQSETGKEVQITRFSLPSDSLAARLALSRGKSCFEDAMNVD